MPNQLEAQHGKASGAPIVDGSVAAHPAGTSGAVVVGASVVTTVVVAPSVSGGATVLVTSEIAGAVVVALPMLASELHAVNAANPMMPIVASAPRNQEVRMSET